LSKLIGENRTNWDEHLLTMLFSYKIAYKVTTKYTPYQLVYGLHPLMRIKYIVRIDGGNQKGNTLVKVLISRVSKLEKLQEARMQVAKTISIQ
jgi:hypothetical protein